MVPQIPPSALPGLTLKAWVKFKVAAGVLTLVSSFNVTGMARNSIGNYTITLTNAMAGTDQLLIFNFDTGGLTVPTCSFYTKSTTVPAVICGAGGALADPVNGYVALYE